MKAEGEVIAAVFVIGVMALLVGVGVVIGVLL